MRIQDGICAVWVQAMMCNLWIQDRTCSQRPVSDLASGAWIPEKHPGRMPIQWELLEASSAELHSLPRAQLVLSSWSAGVSCAPELSRVGVLPGLRAVSLVSVQVSVLPMVPTQTNHRRMTAWRALDVGHRSCGHMEAADPERGCPCAPLICLDTRPAPGA